MNDDKSFCLIFLCAFPWSGWCVWLTARPSSEARCELCWLLNFCRFKKRNIRRLSFAKSLHSKVGTSVVFGETRNGVRHQTAWVLTDLKEQDFENEYQTFVCAFQRFSLQWLLTNRTVWMILMTPVWHWILHQINFSHSTSLTMNPWSSFGWGLFSRTQPAVERTMCSSLTSRGVTGLQWNDVMSMGAVWWLRRRAATCASAQRTTHVEWLRTILGQTYQKPFAVSEPLSTSDKTNSIQGKFLDRNMFQYVWLN